MTNNKSYIYADNAATTMLDPLALSAMLPFLKESFGNPSSKHAWGKSARDAVEKARRMVADCIHASPEEIIFTSGGTESDDWVIQRVGGRCKEVAVSAMEHHAVLNSCTVLPQSCNVTYLSPTKQGVLDLSSVSSAVQSGTSLISIMTANNEVGTIQPVRELASIAHSQGALFHTDAVQAVGHIPVDVRESGVDFLSASAHKFNGPKGVGFLYVRLGVKVSSFLCGGQQENGLRAGTENVASVVGMATALQQNVMSMERTKRKLDLLTEQLIAGIHLICSDAVINGRGAYGTLPGFLSVSFPGCSGEGIQQVLDLKGVAVSTGAACDSKHTKISHVLQAIKLPPRYAKGTIRITLGKSNTEADVLGILSSLRIAFHAMGRA